MQLYIKLGKRIGLTIRQLGDPAKNALLHWHREDGQRLDLPAGDVRQQNDAPAHEAPRSMQCTRKGAPPALPA